MGLVYNNYHQSMKNQGCLMMFSQLGSCQKFSFFSQKEPDFCQID